MKDVSIIIPIFNAEKTIEQTLKSVLNQNFDNYEILVIDDGSTDNTKFVIEQLNNPLIKYIYKQNGGVVSAYTAGIKEADSDYIMFCDSDDFYKPTFINDAYTMITNENVDVISFSADYVNFNGKLLKTSQNGLKCGRYSKSDINEKLLNNITFNSFNNGLTHIIPVFRWNKIYKRELLLNVLNDLDLSIKQLEDNVFTTSVLLNAGSIYIDEKSEYEYVQQETSVSTGYKELLFEEYEKTVLFLKKLFDKYSYNVEDIQFTKLIVASTRVVLRRIAKSSGYKIYKKDFLSIVKRNYFKQIKLKDIDDKINIIFVILLKMKFSLFTYIILKKLF